MQKSEEDDHLVEFVETYSAGPACIVVNYSEIHKPLSLRAHNAAFTSKHTAGLQQLAILGRLSSDQSGSTAGVHWSFTKLRSGSVVCVGSFRDLRQREPSDAVERPLVERANSNGVTGRDGAAWFDIWESLRIPGLDKANRKSHLDLLRGIDFASTGLGPIDSWCPELLTAFTQCLASPSPVMILWGRKDNICLYNYYYSVLVGSKHPQLLGAPYYTAFQEVHELLSIAIEDAFEGRSTHVKNGLIYLERDGYTEETFFTWSMVPIIEPSSKKIVGIYNPCFDVTSTVIADRRLKLLREAGQSLNITSTPTKMFERICSEAAKNGADLPLLVFYDCGASEAIDSQFSNQEKHMLETGSSERDVSVDCNAGRDHALSPLDDNNANPDITFTRSAMAGAGTDNALFPVEIVASENQLASTNPSLAECFRDIQNTHTTVVLEGEKLAELLPFLDKTDLGDTLTCVVLLPILTGDNVLRAIAIAGLNPRKRYDDDYKVFLELFQSQITHGVASIRLVQEELRRSRFFAALIKRKNEELQTLLDGKTRELRRTEERFKKVLEVNPAGICTADPTGRLTFVNQAWYDITGHSKALPADAWAQSILEEDLHIPVKAMRDALDSDCEIRPVEFRWKPRLGEDEPRWTWAIISRNLDEEGVLREITSTLIDQTEKKKAEMLQARRTQEAIEMRHAQERFIDMTSHEVRNPLSAIALSADASAELLQSLSQATGASAPSHEAITETLSNLKIINHCCMHITRLIDDILTLSKLDNQFLVVTAIPCRPVDFVTETFSIFRGEMHAKDIHATLDIRPSLVAHEVDYVLTDPSRINQLLINLTINAIKFTAPCSVRQITVTLDCCLERPALSGHAPEAVPSASAVGNDKPISPGPDEVYLLLSISDTGCGLSQDEISGLFQRFKQANPKTHISYGGSGLGLFVCRRIVALLGGEIGVTSQVGKGSVFSFYVPVKRTAAPVSVPRPSQSPPQRAVPTNGRARDDTISVLIVEDNLVNQKLLDKHLSRMGCITTCANNGREALDVISQSAWGTPGGKHMDIVLMDIEMPVMSGLEAIQEIRQQQKAGALKGTIPVFAVTANARPEQIATMLSNGFDGTVTKPFKVPVILEKMRDELCRTPRDY